MKSIGKIPAVAILLLAVLACAHPLQAATEAVLHIFTGSDGSLPYEALVLDHAGNLYGTTVNGGAYGNGNVFELTNSGGVWTETVLYSFTGLADGGRPFGSLVFDSAGNLYGAASEGGNPDGYGTVFELSLSGSSWIEKTIYTFGNTPGDGCYPQSALTIDRSGNLYGTTYYCGEENGGTVFEVSPSAGGTWTESTLSPLAASSEAGVVFDYEGNLYGTTSGGGNFGQGAVFKLTNLNGSWTETEIFSFTGGENGCTPYGGVTVNHGHLFGTTFGCGVYDVGTLYELTPTVGQWIMTPLHHFTGASDGAEPYAPLVFDSDGNLYGTTTAGGFYGYGTVFRFTLRSGTWGEVEYGFKGNTDGADPFSGVVLGTDSLFGTTSGGGASGLGAVYEITVK